MFDQLLKQSIVESAAVTDAIGHDGGEIPADPVMTAYLETARCVMADPEHVLRLVIRMDGSKTCPWW